MWIIGSKSYNFKINRKLYSRIMYENRWTDTEKLTTHDGAKHYYPRSIANWLEPHFIALINQSKCAFCAAHVRKYSSLIKCNKYTYFYSLLLTLLLVNKQAEANVANHGSRLATWRPDGQGHWQTALTEANAKQEKHNTCT